MTRVRAIALACVMLLSMVAAGAAPAATANANAPAGLDAVPDENVGNQQERGGQGGPPDNAPANAEQWNAHSSAHASDLTLQVGSTPAGDTLELVFGDDVNHDGREVAVDAKTLEDTLGYRPEVAYGLHESGDEWRKPIRYEDGFAIFEIPKFSENTVTFQGTYRIDAEPSVDGDAFTYSVENDSVDNFTINITGSRSSQWVNQSWSNNQTTETYTIDVGGTTAPEGPAAGDPELRLTGIAQTRKDDTDKSFSGGGTTQYTFSDPPDTLTQVSWKIKETDAGGSYNVSVITDGAKTEIYSSGSMMGNDEETVEQSVDIDTGTDVTIEFADTDGSSDFYVYWNSLEGNAARNVTAKADDGTEVNFGNLTAGQTTSKAFGITENATQIDFTAADHGPMNVSLDVEEQTETIDPTVTLNGVTVASHTGTLADGTTATYSPDPALVEENNTVEVVVSEQTDGPTGQVDLNYSHTAAEERAVDYTGETFSERYTFSKTWVESQEDATVDIPWASNRVIEVRSVEVEYYDDEGNYQSTTTPAYSTSNGTLTVELGDIPSGWTTNVTAIGTKVQVTNGTIQVTSATIEGDSLDTQLEVTNISGGGIGLSVGGTAASDRINYLAEESWSDEGSYIIAESDGSQTLYLPEANEGGIAEIGESTISVEPQSGSARIEIVDPDEPRFKIRPGATSGDDITISYYQTVSGVTYELYSISSEETVTTDTAESPVSFIVTDDSQTYSIFSTSGSSGSDGATGGPAGVSSGLSLLLVFGGVGLSMVGFFIVGRRLGGARGLRDNTLLLAGGAVVGLLGLEVLTPSSVVGTATTAVVQIAQSALGALIGGVALLIGLWWVDQRTRADIPRPLLGFASAAVAFLLVETMAPGALTGALADGLDDIAPLIWLGLFGGGGYLAYLWIKSRNSSPNITIEAGDG